MKAEGEEDRGGFRVRGSVADAGERSERRCDIVQGAQCF